MNRSDPRPSQRRKRAGVAGCDVDVGKVLYVVEINEVARPRPALIVAVVSSTDTASKTKARPSLRFCLPRPPLSKGHRHVDRVLVRQRPKLRQHHHRGPQSGQDRLSLASPEHHSLLSFPESDDGLRLVAHPSSAQGDKRLQRELNPLPRFHLRNGLRPERRLRGHPR